MEHQWNDSDGVKRSTRRKLWLTETFPTTNPTWRERMLLAMGV